MDTKAENTPAEAPAAEPSTSKPRMKRPVKPDVEEHKAAVEQLQNEMQKRKARVDEIKQTIDQKRNFDGGPEFQKARSKLNQLSSSFKAQLVSSSFRLDIASKHVHPLENILSEAYELTLACFVLIEAQR